MCRVAQVLGTAFTAGDSSQTVQGTSAWPERKSKATCFAGTTGKNRNVPVRVAFYYCVVLGGSFRC